MHLSILTHHGEPGDPELFEWIMHQLNDALGVGPAAMVVGLGLVIVAIPAATALFFLLKARGRGVTGGR